MNYLKSDDANNGGTGMAICRSCDREATVEYGEDYLFCDECSERFLKDVAKCYLAPKIEIEQGECPK